MYCTMGISFLMLNLGVCQRESALAFFGRALEWGCQRGVKGGQLPRLLKSKDKLYLAFPQPPWQLSLVSHPWDRVIISLPAFNPVCSCSGFHGHREQTLSMLPNPFDPGAKPIVNPTQFCLLVAFLLGDFFPTP